MINTINQQPDTSNYQNNQQSSLTEITAEEVSSYLATNSSIATTDDTPLLSFVTTPTSNNNCVEPMQTENNTENNGFFASSVLLEQNILELAIDLADNPTKFTAEEVNSYLATNSSIATTADTPLLSFVTTPTSNNNCVEPMQTENNTENNGFFASSVLLEQNILELAINNNDDKTLKRIQYSLANDSAYNNLIEYVLCNYISQNKTALIETLYYKYGIFTEKTLIYLLQNQINYKHINLIEHLTSKNIVLTVKFIELLLETNDMNLKTQKIQQLADSDLLYGILNNAVDQDKIHIVEKIYLEHSFTTEKSLNYMLKNVLLNTLDIKLFDKLIIDGASIKLTFDEIIKLEDTEKINNMITFYKNNTPCYIKKIVNLTLNSAINQDKLAIVKMLYEKRNYASTNSLHYLLVNSLKNNEPLENINALIKDGAIITNKDLTNILIDRAKLITLESFLTFMDFISFISFYIKLMLANFPQENKESINTTFKKILKDNIGIEITKNNSLSIIEKLCFNYGIITQDMLDYLLALEHIAKKRHKANLLFEKTYEYKKKLTKIVDNL